MFFIYWLKIKKELSPESFTQNSEINFKNKSENTLFMIQISKKESETLSKKSSGFDSSKTYCLVKKNQNEPRIKKLSKDPINKAIVLENDAIIPLSKVF